MGYRIDRGSAGAVLCILLMAGPAWAKDEPASDGQKDSSTADEPRRPFNGKTFALDVSFEYAGALSSPWGLDVNPFGPGVGARLSWMPVGGFWFGVRATYFFGTTVEQVYSPGLSNLDLEVDAETRATSVGAEFGFDLRLDPVVFRYSLDVGATLFSWDLGDLPYVSLAGYSPMSGSKTGIHLIPGIGLILPLGPAFVGAELTYRIEMDTQIPSAISGGIHAGLRL